MIIAPKKIIDPKSLIDEIELPDNLRKNPRFKRVLRFHVEGGSRRLLYGESVESIRRRIISRVERAREDFLSYRWKRVGKPPRSINERYLESSERSRDVLNEETKNHVLERLRTRALELLGKDLQDVVNLRYDDFDDSIRYQLRKYDLTIFDGLFLVFGGLPFERGESQLAIDHYDGRPLSRYMFRQSDGVWKSVVNRILATRDLCNMLSLQKRVWKITNDDFISQSNPFKRSLNQLLADIKSVYGIGSHLVAMVEADILTLENYSIFREHNMRHSALTPSQIAEISVRVRGTLNDEKQRTRNRREFKIAGYTNSQIDRIFGPDASILNDMGISVYDPVDEGLVKKIKSFPWSIRKRVGYELYLMGRELSAIASMIGTESDTNRVPQRQNIEYVIDPSSLEKRMHYDAQKERMERKQRIKLKQMCQDHNVSLRRFQKVVDEYHDVLDTPRISEFFGLPHAAISLYLQICEKKTLPTEDVDLIELMSLYGSGDDISPKGMQSSQHTANLYARLSIRWGSYVNALKGVNVDPEDVYHRPRRKEIAA